MARGTTPRPSGGARGAQPSRGAPARGGKVAPRTGKTGAPQRPHKQPTTSPGGKSSLTNRIQTEQQRRILEEQRRAAARVDASQRLRQQLSIREAHLRRREQEAVARTSEVQDQVARLGSILSTGLARSARIDLDALRRSDPPAEFDPGPLARAAPEPVWEKFAPSDGPLAGLLGQARRERREAAAREAYERARATWQRAEAERQRRLTEARRVHEARVARESAARERYHARLDRIATGLRDRDPKAVESFLRTVLRRVPLPAGFPRGGEAYHDPEREWVVVRYGLPERDVIPEVIAYEFDEPTDQLRPVPRPASDAGELYRRVLAQVVLLVVRDVLEAESRLAGVTCYGHVEVAGEDGAAERRELIGLTADRESFEQIGLLEMPAVEVLMKLDATVSPDPYGYAPLLSG